ncbi:MAG: hypothetical protein BZ138_08100 [Methanosphaera sp. rholeuAM270]|nr:MAG: hypothetical protein BZ138_08100 [Methanosphaera sp. rholeuAM270]
MIKVLEGNKIGYPTSPSLWTGEPEYVEIMVFTVSCGGGMGGSKWYEYVLREEINPNTLQEFTTIEGDKILINTSNVVKVSYYTLVRARYKTINYIYFEVKSEYETNPIDTILEKGSEREVQLLVKDGTEVELVNATKDEVRRGNY